MARRVRSDFYMTRSRFVTQIAMLSPSGGLKTECRLDALPRCLHFSDLEALSIEALTSVLILRLEFASLQDNCYQLTIANLVS